MEKKCYIHANKTAEYKCIKCGNDICKTCISINKRHCPICLKEKHMRNIIMDSIAFVALVGLLIAYFLLWKPSLDDEILGLSIKTFDTLVICFFGLSVLGGSIEMGIRIAKVLKANTIIKLKKQ